MCGIVAYVGKDPAAPVLLEGLKRLEYRGYDSAGVALMGEPGGETPVAIDVCRSIGRVSALEAKLDELDAQRGGAPRRSRLGIAHTRWATHGKVTEANAHPHVGQTAGGATIAVVHNGTIENYAALRKLLEKKGHTFYSETDTEVIAKLIAELYCAPDGASDGGDACRQPVSNAAGATGLEAAVQAALQEVTGAYAIAATCNAEPHTIVAARKGSPLLVGIAEGGYVVASDGSAIIQHTSQAIMLDDYQVVRLSAGPAGTRRPGAPDAEASAWVDPFRTTDLDDVEIKSAVRELELELDEIELGDYEHYMLKEIMEQPASIEQCFRGRVDTREKRIVLGGVADLNRELVRAGRVILTGQGTAYHAGLIGEYLMEDIAKLPARATYASEFRYRNPIIEDNTVMIAISQSGETADTLAALEEAKDRGAMTFGAVNVVGSTMSRVTDAGVYLRVGPEIGVASTKAFVGQVAVLTMLALYMGRRRYLSQERLGQYLDQLAQVPDHIGRLCTQSDMIRRCCEQVVDRDNWLFLGRGYNYPVALEGALKLKEISYIHAEGMPAAEMKHGPIALIDEGMPVVFIATQGSQYDKVISNIEEVKARGGRIIAVATEGDRQIDQYCEDGFVFRVPDVEEALQPLLTVVPLQLLAYHAALLRGHDVDKPRNLAKSVTVE